MPFTLDQFARRWPCLYHLTAAMNVAGIAADGCLYPAAETFRLARKVDDIREHRKTFRIVTFPSGVQRHVRDQRPLSARHTATLGGWTFADLVQELNERVYFWPGDERGPIMPGRNYLARYANAEDDPRVLRLDTAALIAANPKLSPEFCRFNSGSPRCNPKSKETGKRSPRGPETFLAADRFDGSVGSVVEVTFRGVVRLDGLRVEWKRPEG